MLLGARTLLVNPPLVDGAAFTRQGRCQERDDVLGTTKPPLSLAWIAAELRGAGCDARLIDLTAERRSVETLAADLARDNWTPTLIIFASAFPTWDRDARAISTLKARFGAALVAFGPHASSAPRASLLRAPDVDALIVGEPEDAALALAQLGADADWSSVPALEIRRRDGELVAHRARGGFTGFNNAVAPDWAGIDFSNYRLPLVNAPYVLVETSRGCPYTCDFCVAPIQQGHAFRSRAAPLVIDEIEKQRRERGLEYFYLWGDTVTLNVKVFGEFADALIARQLNVKWLANARAENLADPAFVAKLKASGCWMLSFGVEASSPEGRDVMQKRLSESAIHTAIRNLRQAGIYSFAFFILGHPGETRASMERTVQYASDLGVDFAGFYPAVPYPGTAMGDRAAAEGLLTHPDDWSRLEYSYYAMQHGDVDEAAVMHMVARARRKFFFRPQYLARHAFELARVAMTKPGVSARVAMQMLGRRT